MIFIQNLITRRP